MPIPKGRPRAPADLEPLDHEVRMLRDMEWAIEYGKAPSAKPPCYSAKVMVDYYCKKPKTFLRQYFKLRLDLRKAGIAY